MTEISPLSVSEITEHIRAIVESDGALRRVYVRGELSNYKIYPSGHHYFTLKDAGASIRCVMFRADASRLRFRPENGMAVICSGRVAVYPRDGAYQLYVTVVQPEGLGDLHAAYEQLKAKLLAEGLFAQEHKKPLPAMPEKIALITSGAGAAVQDMIRILGRRWPLTKILVMPVRVQGTEAPAEIAGAIRYANRWNVADLIITGRGGGSIEDLWAFNDERVARAIFASEIPVISAVGHEPDVTIADFVADVRAATPSNGAEIAGAIRYANRWNVADLIITGRGGGSIEDLWAFNDERVARAIFASEIPVISAVGHEPDVTIADFVADVRAATPSNGAEIAVPEQADVRALLLSLENRLGQAERKRLDALASRLNELSARPVLQSPTGFLQNRRLDVDRLSDRLNAAEKHLLLAKRQEYVRLVSSLEAMSPLKVLARGFSVATDASGAILRDAKAVAPGDSVHIRLEHGALDCRVEHQSEVQ